MFCVEHNDRSIALIRQSRKYHTMYHFVTHMCALCTFILQSGAPWDTGQVHGEICATGLLYQTGLSFIHSYRVTTTPNIFLYPNPWRISWDSFIMSVFVRIVCIRMRAYHVVLMAYSGDYTKPDWDQACLCCSVCIIPWRNCSTNTETCNVKKNNTIIYHFTVGISRC